jgi:hypothetical protein
MQLNVLLHYNLLNMFRALICPSSGARDYACGVTAYSVQCFKDEKCWVALCMFRVLWELHYCVSLAMKRVDCVKCVEGV